MTSDPAHLKRQQQLAALKAENRRLQHKLAKLEVEKFSLQSEIAALKKQLKQAGVPDRGEMLHRARQRVFESKT